MIQAIIIFFFRDSYIISI